MKRLLIPLAMLALIIGFCAASTWYVDRICTDASELLAQAEARFESGDYEGAGEMVSASLRLWDAHEGFLGMALRHTESDDIRILYPPLLETCREQDPEEFNHRNLELRAALRMLSRMEIPYYFNVF